MLVKTYLNTIACVTAYILNFHPCVLLAALSYLCQWLLSVAKENPSEQQTYLHIELVVHHQNNPQRAAPIRKSAQIKKLVKSLFRRKSLQKEKLCDAI